MAVRGEEEGVAQWLQLVGKMTMGEAARNCVTDTADVLVLSVVAEQRSVTSLENKSHGDEMVWSKSSYSPDNRRAMNAAADVDPALPCAKLAPSRVSYHPHDLPRPHRVSSKWKGILFVCLFMMHDLRTCSTENVG